MFCITCVHALLERRYRKIKVKTGLRIWYNLELMIDCGLNEIEFSKMIKTGALISGIGCGMMGWNFMFYENDVIKFPIVKME